MERFVILWSTFIIVALINQGESFVRDDELSLLSRERRFEVPLDDEESEESSGADGYVSFNSDGKDPMQFETSIGRKSYRPDVEIFLADPNADQNHRPELPDFDDNAADVFDINGNDALGMLLASPSGTNSSDLSYEDEAKMKLGIDIGSNAGDDSHYDPSYFYPDDYYESFGPFSTELLDTSTATSKGRGMPTYAQTEQPNATDVMEVGKSGEEPVVIPDVTITNASTAIPTESEFSTGIVFIAATLPKSTSAAPNQVSPAQPTQANLKTTRLSTHEEVFASKVTHDSLSTTPTAKVTENPINEERTTPRATIKTKMVNIDVTKMQTSRKAAAHQSTKPYAQMPTFKVSLISTEREQTSSAVEVTRNDILPRTVEFSMVVLIITLISVLIVLIVVAILVFLVRARLRRRGKYDISSDVDSDGTLTANGQNGKNVKFHDDIDKKEVVTVQYNDSLA